MKGMKGFSGPAVLVARESMGLAAGNLGRERARSALSLLGVCIGIFCIVASMTLFDSLRRSLREGMEEFGTDALFVEKLPLEPDLDESGTFRWWRYMGRPEPSYEEFLFLRDNSSLAEEITFSATYGQGNVIAVTEGWRSVVHNGLDSGRFFSPGELRSGSAVAIAGALALDGKEETSAEIGGTRVTVIGRLKQGGINTVSIAGDIDNALIVPFLWAGKHSSLTPEKSTVTLIPRAGIKGDELRNETTRLMRRFRRIPEGGDDSFAVNSISFIASEVNSLFARIGAAGWIIGLFSLLVGGFGIANIMFVSVAERSAEIGLQKALGATRGAITLQYLCEAALLSLAGAAAGLALSLLLCKAVPSTAIELSVSPTTAAAATVAALMLGTLSGLAPALRAAALAPVTALSR